MPAISNARRPETTPGVSVNEGIWLIRIAPIPSPYPRIHAGFRRASRARSRPTRTTAPPESVTTQQSFRWRGAAIIGEARTSSTVIGSRKRASGLGPAFARHCTAMAAS